MTIVDDLMGASRQPSYGPTGGVLVPRGLLAAATDRITELEAALAEEKSNDNRSRKGGQ